MQRTLSSLLLAATLGACVVGPQLERTPVARNPGGAALTLQTRGDTLAGELLAVHDTAVLVLDRERVVALVPFRVIRDSRIDLAGEVTRGGRTPSAAHRERLRRLSRYPSGIDPAVQRALLAALGQAEVEVIRR